MQPLVTVLMATYNQAGTLPEALEALRRQTLPAARREILVVNDGSTDSTEEILRAHSGWLRVISRPNRGLAASCNEGLELASGKFLARMDSDDLVSPDWLERMAAALQEHPEASCAVPDRYETGGEEKRRVQVDPSNLYSLIACGTLFRAEQLRSLGGYRSFYWEEYDLYLRLRPLGPFLRVASPLYTYRRHEAAMTWDSEARRQGWRQLAETWGEQALRAAGSHSDLEEALR